MEARRGPRRTAILLSIAGYLAGCLAPGRVAPARTVFPEWSSASGAPASVTVPLEVGEFSASVDVVVGDAKARSFLIDTGAQLCALPRSWALELGLDLRPVLGSLTGVTKTSWGWHRIARIERLSIGDVCFEGLDAYVIDDAFLARPLLGFRVFEELRVTLDFPRARLTMQPEDAELPSSEDVPIMDYRLRSDRPEIEIDVDGLRLRAILDTGLDDVLYLPDRMERRIELEAPPLPVRYGRTVNDFAVTRAARARGDLLLAAYRFRRPVIGFGRGEALLGFGALRHFALTFDLHRRTVRFEGPDPGVGIECPPVLGFGFILSRDAEHGVVLSVQPGGPAALAGLQVGDTVTGIAALHLTESSPASVSLTVQRGGERLSFHIERGVVVE